VSDACHCLPAAGLSPELNREDTELHVQDAVNSYKYHDDDEEMSAEEKEAAHTAIDRGHLGQGAHLGISEKQLRKMGVFMAEEDEPEPSFKSTVL